MKGQGGKSLPSAGSMRSMRAVPSAGFSLLELVAVITIMALVLGVSAPAVQKLYQSSQYRGAISDVVSSLNAARYSAIREGRHRDILIYPAKREIELKNKTQRLPQSLQIEVLGSQQLNRDGAGVVRFYPDGGSSGGYVNIAHANGMAVQVQVDWLLGRVTLCKENCEEF